MWGYPSVKWWHLCMHPLMCHLIERQNGQTAMWRRSERNAIKTRGLESQQDEEHCYHSILPFAFTLSSASTLSRWHKLRAMTDIQTTWPGWTSTTFQVFRTFHSPDLSQSWMIPALRCHRRDWHHHQWIPHVTPTMRRMNQPFVNYMAS